jgi:hypothetical protein
MSAGGVFHFRLGSLSHAKVSIRFMNLKLPCGRHLKKALLWAVAIETTLFFCGVYTGAIDRGPHDPMVVLFGLSQAIGLVVICPITIVLSRVLPEHQASVITWTGVFGIQSLFFTLLVWRALSYRNRIDRTRACQKE